MSSLETESDGSVLPLHEAVQAGNAKNVRQLLNKGSVVNAKDAMGRTPLHWAIVFGEEDIAKMLLMNTPRRALQAADQYGRTALHYAAGLGRSSLARVILDRGASVDVLDKRQVAPLHLAAENVTEEMVELLLSKGADKSRRDCRGWLPMHYASRQGARLSADLLAVKDVAAKVQPATETEMSATEGGCNGHASVSEKLREVERRSSNEMASSSPGTKTATLEELLSAWKGAGSAPLAKKIEKKSAKFRAVESALDEWRTAAKAKKSLACERKPAVLDRHLLPSDVETRGASQSQSSLVQAISCRVGEATRAGTSAEEGKECGRVGQKRQGEQQQQQEQEELLCSQQSAGGSSVKQQQTLGFPIKKQKDHPVARRDAMDVMSVSEELLTWNDGRGLVGSLSQVAAGSEQQRIPGFAQWESMPGLVHASQPWTGKFAEASAVAPVFGAEARLQKMSLELLAMAMEAVAFHSLEEDSSWCTEWDSGLNKHDGEIAAREKLEEWTRQMQGGKDDPWGLSAAVSPVFQLGGMAISAN